jgi:hypothetical protein
MGKQQFLLALLVTIVVAVATVTALNVFSKASDNANIEAVNDDLSSLVADAQGYYMRPATLGGGGRSFNGLTFRNFSFPANAVGESGLVAENENGRYIITEGNRGVVIITAHPASCEGYRPSVKDSDGNLTVNSASGCETPIIAEIKPDNFLLTGTASVN